MRVSESVWSQDVKNFIFISVRCLEMLKIAVWKMTSSIDTVWDYMFTKNICIKLKFGMPDLHAWLYNILYGFQKILKILDFEISYIKILVFKFLGDFFWKIRDSHLKKKLFILRLLVLFNCILLKITVFGYFSNICYFGHKWHAIGSHIGIKKEISKFCVGT